MFCFRQAFVIFCISLLVPVSDCLLWRILQTGIPGILANIEKGCREYDEYIRLGGKESQLPIRSPQDFCDATIASH